MSYISQTANAISTTSFNSRSAATLAAGATFQGVSEEVSKYGRAGVAITSTNATDGTLTFEVSHDGVTWGGPSRTWADTRFAQPHMWNIVEKYFRIKYVNGTTEATALAIQVQYSVNADIILGHQLNAALSNETEASVVRAVAVGEDPLGTFSNTKHEGVVFDYDTTLSANANFASDVLDARGYSQLQTTMQSDVNGIMKFEFANDASLSTVLRTLSVNYTAPDFAFYAAPTFTGYVRYSYQNGASAQAAFHYDTKFLTNSQNGQIMAVDQEIRNKMVATLGRNVIVGQNDAGNFNNVETNEQNELRVAVPHGAFGALAVEELTPLIQLTFPYNINTLLVNTVSGGGGYVSQADNMAVVSTTATISSTAVLESKARIKYRAGQGAMARWTTLYTIGSAAGSKQHMGIGEAGEGYYFGYQGTQFGIQHRTNDAVHNVPQSAWSVDTMDGSKNLQNPSGMLLDHTKGNVYQVQYQWLGYGAIKYYIEHEDDGEMGLVHVDDYANKNIVPSSYDPTFHVRMEVSNAGSTDDYIMKSSSMAAFIEGTDTITGPIESVSVGGTSTVAQKNLLTLRSVLNFPTGSANECKVSSYLRKLALSNDGANNTIVKVEIIEGGTFTGTPAYTFIDENRSTIEYDNAGVYTAGTGRVLETFLLTSSDAKNIDLTSDKIALEHNGTVSFIMSNDVSTDTSVGISWVEDF